MWMDFKYEEFDYMMELLETGVAAGAFREVNLPILRMILITSTHNLNDADFLREKLRYLQNHSREVTGLELIRRRLKNGK